MYINSTEFWFHSVYLFVYLSNNLNRIANMCVLLLSCSRIAEFGGRNEKDGSLIWEISGATPGPKICRKEVSGRRGFKSLPSRIYSRRCRMQHRSLCPRPRFTKRSDGFAKFLEPHVNRAAHVWRRILSSHTYLVRSYYENVCRRFDKLVDTKKVWRRLLLPAPDRNPISQGWMERSSIMWERDNCDGRKNNEAALLQRDL